LRPAEPRNETEIDLRLAELCRVGSEDEVARQCQLESPTERKTIDGRNDGDGQLFKPVHHLVAKEREGAAVQRGHLPHRSNVRTGYEGAVARAREDQTPEAGVRAQRVTTLQ